MDDKTTRKFLLSPAPLMDPDNPTDPYVEVTADAQPGGFRVRTRSEAELRGRATAPAPGVLRLQLNRGPAPDRLRSADLDEPRSPLLAEGLSQAPAHIESVTGGIVFHADGVTHRWVPAEHRAYGPILGMVDGTTHSDLSDTALAGGTIPHGFRHIIPLGPLDAIYGGGESYQGPDLRGRVRRGVNVETHGIVGTDPSYLNVPFFFSDAGWGIFANTGTPFRTDIGATHTDVFALDIHGDTLDLFLYTGDAPTILAAHHTITGPISDTFPDWALGVWTSRCTYLNAAKVNTVLDGYAAADCPVDVLHIDSWQPGNLLNDLTTHWEVDRHRWPQGWQADLEQRGVRLSLWHNPFLSRDTEAGREALERGFVLINRQGDPVATNDMPNRLLVDFTNPAARQWWRQKIHALVTEENVAALKADFAEEVPPEAIAFDGRTGWQLRNEYSLLYQTESAAALAELTDQPRALFCRSGTAGSQRTPCHWVGDAISTWSGLAASLRGCLSLSLSGFGYVAHDVGGFWHPDHWRICLDATATNDPNLFTTDVDPELFLRWTQFGALSPVMRFHGTGKREPWAYPAPYGTLAVQACQLRQRLRPYLHATSRQVATTGMPMMRPLPLAYPSEPQARAAEAQEYLLGDDLLVAPVLQPDGHINFWIPPGKWTAIGGAPDLTGPGWTQLQLPLAAIPVWRRDTHSCTVTDLAR